MLSKEETVMCVLAKECMYANELTMTERVFKKRKTTAVKTVRFACRLLEKLVSEPEAYLPRKKKLWSQRSSEVLYKDWTNPHDQTNQP